MGSHAIHCVLLRRELCCCGVDVDGTVRLREGRRTNKGNKAARLRRQARWRERRQRQQLPKHLHPPPALPTTTFPSPVILPIFPAPSAAVSPAATCLQEQVADDPPAHPEGWQVFSQEHPPDVGAYELDTPQATRRAQRQATRCTQRQATRHPQRLTAGLFTRRQSVL